MDDKVVHGGRLSVRIERDAASPNDFSTITKSIPLDFSGATIELRGYLRTELKAQDHAAANAMLLRWIDSLATVKPCDPCAKVEQTNLQFGPDLGWIADTKALGAELSRRLMFIRDNRQTKPQFYVSLVQKIGNPKFEHELSYGNLKFPDSGFQLLSLYRLWNIIEYWSPYRNVLGEDWNSVLAEFIPRLATAKEVESYKQQLLLLIAKVHDGHANLWNALEVRPPAGKCQIPVMVRFVQAQPTIARLLADGQPNSGDLKAGDVITELDGVAVSQLIEDWKPYYATSNGAALYLILAQAMTRGECGGSVIGVRRGNANLRVKVGRVPITASAGESWHDLPGPTFRLLSEDVAYLKLSSVKAADCAHYVDQAAGTKGLIIDIRNYPSEFVVFDLGTHLVGEETICAIYVR